MATLVDTGPLVALANRSDQDHARVREWMSHNREALIVPAPVVTEASIVLLDRFGAEAELSFLRSLANKELLVEHPNDADLTRSIEVLDRYRDAKFGLVDAMTMAMGERFGIETILTLDRRDFSIFRPRHCAAFRLLPEL